MVSGAPQNCALLYFCAVHALRKGLRSTSPFVDGSGFGPELPSGRSRYILCLYNYRHYVAMMYEKNHSADTVLHRLVSLCLLERRRKRARACDHSPPPCCALLLVLLASSRSRTPAYVFFALLCFFPCDRYHQTVSSPSFLCCGELQARKRRIVNGRQNDEQTYLSTLPEILC